MALTRASCLRRNLISILCLGFFVVIFLKTQPTLDAARRSTNYHLSRVTGGRLGVKTSQLHLVIPASHPSDRLCYNLVSAAANGYPAPQLVGWHGVGVLDASKTHLAKLRAIQRYLNSLKPDEDADVILIVDAYDIIHQLPPEVMIERYFDVAHQADVALAKRFNMTLEKLYSRNLRQTVFWGPDKTCFPLDWRAPRCWAVPPSSLKPQAFGPNTNEGDMSLNEPRWLNSGTAMGPIGDMRRVIDATMAEIAQTHDPEYEFRESDQYYISNVWGRQEYWRSLQLTQGAPVPRPDDGLIPQTKLNGSDAELHMAIEYESRLFQTKAAYENFFGYLQFNEAGHRARMGIDMFGLGHQFRPYAVKMPKNVLLALKRLFDGVAEAHPGVKTEDWIRSVKLGVNYVTGHIYGLWHCTGAKDDIDAEYSLLWWYPYAESLVKAAVKSSQGGRLISSKAIDGRRWASKSYHAEAGTEGASEYGGAWSDEVEGGKFVGWQELCEPYQEVLFRGERGGMAVQNATIPQAIRRQK